MLTPAKVVQALEMAQQCQARSYKNCDMVVTGSARAVINRDLIIALAARHKLPAIYFERYFVGAGGLISYGPDFIDQFRQAALIASLKVKNCQSSGASAEQVRACRQSQDRQSI